MFIKQIQLQQFRCFAQKAITFEQPIVLIEGDNGSGKTTVLEAIYYACYLRSFRTHTPRELTQFEQDTFCVKIDFEHQSIDQMLDHHLHIGYSGKKRLVKLDQKAIGSYKELMDYFRVVALTDDDMSLIKQGPDQRRQFIDQAISLYDYAYLQLLKEHKTIVDNRNSLLQQMRFDKESYLVWTEQLWHKAVQIEHLRRDFLELMQAEVDRMIRAHFDEPVVITFSYKPKMMLGSSFDAFFAAKNGLLEQERRMGRTLFGAHLDDIAISFQGAHSRAFASRGQQKLITLLIKIAQLRILYKAKGQATFLLDDFMTDFDEKRAETALRVLAELEGQLVFTAPRSSTSLGVMLEKQGAQRILISG